MHTKQQQKWDVTRWYNTGNNSHRPFPRGGVKNGGVEERERDILCCFCLKHLGYDIINDLFMICWDPLWIPSLQSVYLLFATMMDLFFTSHGLHKSRGITSPFVAPSELRPSTSSIVVLLLDHGRRRPSLLTLFLSLLVKKKREKRIFYSMRPAPPVSSCVDRCMPFIRQVSVFGVERVSWKTIFFCPCLFFFI